MISFENPLGVVTAQYFRTEGNAKGKWVDDNGESLVTEGYSLFGDLNIPDTEDRLAVFGRLDHFDVDTNDMLAPKSGYTMAVGGVVYKLYKGNMLLLVFESTSFEDNAGAKGKLPVIGNKQGDEQKIQAVYQIKF